MSTKSADERTVKRLVCEEIRRDSEHRRGPKRDINKITRILINILTNDKLNKPALTIRDINIPNIKTNDLEDYLAFLSKFPKERPFLKTCRRLPCKDKPGAPLKEYRFDTRLVLEWRQESKPLELGAHILLEGNEPLSECPDVYGAWQHFTYLDTINLHNTIKPEGQDSITVNLIRDFQHPPFKS